jgi:peptide/nickel transport system permease protein
LNLAIMVGHLVRHLATLVVALLAASFLVFGAMFVAPGSPDALLFGNTTVDPATRAAVHAKYHLDDPFLERYVHWLGGIVRGDLGISLAYRQPVSERITAAAPTTALLVGYAGLLIVVSGIGLGALSALRPGKVATAIDIGTTVGIALPTFVAAALLTSLFAVKLDWLPVQGPGSGVLDRIRHLTLPAVSLALIACALLARVTRAAIVDELGQEHVETARARGLSERLVVRRHVLRNALIPIVTVAGLQLAGLIAGTLVVEQVYGLGGLGQLLVTSVNQKDFPVVQAVCLVMVAAFLVVNTVVDILYGLLDPRVRQQRAPR